MSSRRRVTARKPTCRHCVASSAACTYCAVRRAQCTGESQNSLCTRLAQPIHAQIPRLSTTQLAAECTSLQSSVRAQRLALSRSQGDREAELRRALRSDRQRALRAPKVAPRVLELQARERRLLAAGLFEEAAELRRAIAPALASASAAIKEREDKRACAAVEIQRVRHQAARSREGARAARHLAMLEHQAVRAGIEQ